MLTVGGPVFSDTVYTSYASSKILNSIFVIFLQSYNYDTNLG